MGLKNCVIIHEQRRIEQVRADQTFVWGLDPNVKNGQAGMPVRQIPFREDFEFDLHSQYP